jgi:hypothetical protein
MARKRLLHRVPGGPPDLRRAKPKALAPEHREHLGDAKNV